MDRSLSSSTWALLLAAAFALGGCGGGASGLTTGATQPADAPSGINNEHPMARPISVACGMARARRCGFYFDPGKLRSSYLAYESQHGAAGDQLAKIQYTYDSTFNTISQRVGADADYCTDKKGADIKADLQRHLAGDFTPKPAKAGGGIPAASSVAALRQARTSRSTARTSGRSRTPTPRAGK